MEDDSRGRVTLITLHSAKGLEFPVVFIAGVEEGLSRSIARSKPNSTDPAPLEEERRLFYVGITRAKKLLYMTFTGARMSYGKYTPAVASRFLASLPESNRPLPRQPPVVDVVGPPGRVLIRCRRARSRKQPRSR